MLKTGAERIFTFLQEKTKKNIGDLRDIFDKVFTGKNTHKEQVKIDFPTDYEVWLDTIGNLDDYRPALMETTQISLDGKSGATNAKETFKKVLSVTYKKRETKEYIFAPKLSPLAIVNQISMILNTELYGKAFGNEQSGFYGETFEEKETVEMFPELRNFLLQPVESGYAKNSVLYAQIDKDSPAIPVCAVLKTPSSQDETGKWTNKHIRVVWLKGSNQLDELAKECIGAVIIKFCKQGFPTFSEIIDTTGKRITNPFSIQGNWKPQQDFFESDSRAIELRDLTIDLLAYLQKSFENENQSSRSIAQIDQKAEAIVRYAKQVGIELDTFTLLGLKGPERNTPLAEVAFVVATLLKDLFRVTGSSMSYDRAVQEGNEMRQSNDSGDDEESQLGSILSADSLQEQQKDSLYIGNLLRYVQERLSVSDEEMDQRKDSM